METISQRQSALLKQRASGALSQLDITVEDVAKVAMIFGLSSHERPLAVHPEF